MGRWLCPLARLRHDVPWRASGTTRSGDPGNPWQGGGGSQPGWLATGDHAARGSFGRGGGVGGSRARGGGVGASRARGGGVGASTAAASPAVCCWVLLLTY